MKYDNEINLIIDSRSQNESLARVVVATFVAQLDPTLAEITDIKTSLSEAVTNSIIHGYENNLGKIYINCKLLNDEVFIEVNDDGIGIQNIQEAMEPLFTSKPNMERSGMGFTVMQTFMDTVRVESNLNQGTKIFMTKKITRS